MFSMNYELERGRYLELLRPFFLKMGFEYNVKESGNCFLRVAFDVFEENNYMGSEEEKKLILGTAALLIVIRGACSTDSKYLMANEIAIAFRRRTGTWRLGSKINNGDSQTPCILGKINVDQEPAKSPVTYGGCWKSTLKQEGLKKQLNTLINMMKSLISTGGSK